MPHCWPRLLSCICIKIRWGVRGCECLSINNIHSGRTHRGLHTMVSRMSTNRCTLSSVQGHLRSSGENAPAQYSTFVATVRDYNKTPLYIFFASVMSLVLTSLMIKGFDNTVSLHHRQEITQLLSLSLEITIF